MLRARQITTTPQLPAVVASVTLTRTAFVRDRTASRRRLADRILDVCHIRSKADGTIAGPCIHYDPTSNQQPRLNVATQWHPWIREIAVADFDPISGGLGKDIQHSIRTLTGSPGFTTVALLSLSLGICIAACAFSEMNGMVLRDLPVVAKPGKLATLEWPTTYPDYKRFRERRDVFASAGAYIAHTFPRWG